MHEQWHEHFHLIEIIKHMNSAEHFYETKIIEYINSIYGLDNNQTEIKEYINLEVIIFF